MTTSTANRSQSAYMTGVRHGAPFIIMALPFAVLFGVVAIDAGLTLAQTMGFTVLVIAGASQFAAIQLMVENASIALVVLGALAVNLRMAMYSASLVPYLGAAPLWKRGSIAYLLFDQTYITAVAQYEAAPKTTMAARTAYFFGVATPIAPCWMLATLFGALVGQAIPEAWALDFIMPIMFLSMVAPMLKSLAHVAAAAVSIIVALALIGLPAGTGLLVAAFAAMVTGAVVETWQEARKI
ncbi:MAG: AzlC family ABC transporter permease [Pseudomonadota bacterium]